MPIYWIWEIIYLNIDKIYLKGIFWNGDKIKHNDLALSIYLRSFIC